MSEQEWVVPELTGISEVRTDDGLLIGTVVGEIREDGANVATFLLDERLAEMLDDEEDE